ncbi:MAG: LLM class flavin-dependent oxidoreductase, partial [Kutzneria sp.]|nr:LLM class flavin-dependent oxidoreductase [Kutzneria sp.]
MAAATQRIRLTANFANNLFRSPVEFAQASLTMQRASHGRWEAGFGAGWAQEELESTGQTYPTPRRRADRYIEAVQVVRQLFHTNRCSFSGEHYNINVPALAGFENLTPPPLIGSLGGPRTIAGATPYLDRVELMPATGVARGGELDWAAIAAIPKQRLID